MRTLSSRSKKGSVSFGPALWFDGGRRTHDNARSSAESAATAGYGERKLSGKNGGAMDQAIATQTKNPQAFPLLQQNMQNMSLAPFLALNSLCQIVLGSNAPEKLSGKMDGNTWWVEADRKTFYDNLDAVTKGKAFTDLIGNVSITLPDAHLATSARTDFPSLLTLLTLSPFTLHAREGYDAAVEAALQANWTNDYSNWQADQDLTAEQRAAGQANFSDQYLADRASFLTNISTANLIVVGGDPSPSANNSQWRKSA